MDPAFDYQRCVRNSQAVQAPKWLNLGMIDLDFGPTEAVDPDFELVVAGWLRRISLKAQLEVGFVCLVAGWQAGREWNRATCARAAFLLAPTCLCI